jgi:acetolactate decarboxylase
MGREIIDERLVGALHLRALTRKGLAHDPVEEKTVYQASTLAALMEGRFAGDLTLGELLTKGDLGLGTVSGLGGELVILDGVAWLIDAEGKVHRPPLDTTTPFAVVTPFRCDASFPVKEPLALGTLIRRIDDFLGDPTAIVAVRLRGRFEEVGVRSVRAQQPPYPSLLEVTAHQTEWELPEASGTVVGFRFPDTMASLDVPGYHLHFLGENKDCGGHVFALTLVEGLVELHLEDTLHVELPAAVGLGEPGVADRAGIRQAEGKQE